MVLWRFREVIHWDGLTPFIRDALVSLWTPRSSTGVGWKCVPARKACSQPLQILEERAADRKHARE